MLGENTWLTVSFLATLIPATILLFLYAGRTRFWVSSTGWAMFWLLLVLVLGSALSVIALIFTEWAASDVGLFFRTAGRFALAAMLWNLLRVFLKIQNQTEVHDGDPEPR